MLERKNKTIFIGNTLEKPSLLLKREFVKDTTTNNENVAQEGGFAANESAAQGSQFAKERN